jgi:hypothetical protein
MRDKKTRTRISYTKDKFENRLFSEIYTSARNGGKYRVFISLDKIIVKVKNIKSRRIVKKSNVLTGLSYSKIVAKKFLRQLGVDLKFEVRNITRRKKCE